MRRAVHWCPAGIFIWVTRVPVHMSESCKRLIQKKKEKKKGPHRIFLVTGHPSPPRLVVKLSYITLSWFLKTHRSDIKPNPELLRNRHILLLYYRHLFIIDDMPTKASASLKRAGKLCEQNSTSEDRCPQEILLNFGGATSECIQLPEMGSTDRLNLSTFGLASRRNTGLQPWSFGLQTVQWPCNSRILWNLGILLTTID